MGCNGSKQADIQRDRRQREQGRPAGRDGIKSSGLDKEAKSQAIGMKHDDVKAVEGNEGVYGKSWTEDHLAEQDFLKNIIEKTQADFIDVTHETNILDDKEMEERMSRYAQHTEDGDVDVRACEELLNVFDIPKGTISEEEAQNVIKTLKAGESTASPLAGEVKELHKELVDGLNELVSIEVDPNQSLIIPIDSFGM